MSWRKPAACVSGISLDNPGCFFMTAKATAFNPMAIPEYREAIKLERDCRDAAFLNIPADICGLKIRQMTARDFMILEGTSNPIISGGGDPSEADISGFLHLMAVNRSPWHRFRKLWRMDYRKALDAIGKYLETTFQDTPGGSSSSPCAPTASWLAYQCEQVASEYGWNYEYTMGIPLRILNQFCNLIQKRHSPHYKVHARHGKVLGDRLKKKNEEFRVKLLNDARQSLVDILARRARS